ncbi:MAG: hypothetical protein JXA21_11400 [Anaerolineae bacterium]|nr:hypothetical protein [Anaerolineae bacterium]
MFAVARDSGEGAARRVLSYKRLAGELRDYGLPLYSAVMATLPDFNVYRLACNLWRSLFPNDPAPAGGDVWEVEGALLWRIDGTLFPLAWDIEQEFYYGEAHPLLGFVEHAGCGIPWEVDQWDSIEEAHRPLAAIVAAGLAPIDGWDAAKTQFETESGEWLLAHGWAPLAADAASQHATIREKLAGLDAPWDGLAVVYDCLTHENPNPFISTPEFYRYDYEALGFLCEWTPEDLRRLQEQYNAAVPDLEKRQGYEGWWQLQPTGAAAREHVLGLLAQTFELEVAGMEVCDDD